MMIQTSIWGELEVSENQIYTFSKGIPGFDEERQFALIPEEDSSFLYLQSLRQSQLAFVVTDPFLFFSDYEFELPSIDAEELQIDDELFVKCIVTLNEKAEQSSINLLAPLVFNSKLRLGKQIVLQHSDYRTKHCLWTDSIDSNRRDGV